MKLSMSQHEAANPTLFRQVKIVLPPTNEHYGERVTQNLKQCIWKLCAAGY
jgi:hypothetical protein